MAIPTSEERREAAANLRKIHLGGANKDLIELMLSDAIGAWHENGISWDYITERLADLIDPTCQINSVEPIEYGEFNETIGSAFHLTCGHTVLRACTDMPPAYCDECGARVVSGDAQ